LGHEERFPPTRLCAGCGFRKETIDRAIIGVWRDRLEIKVTPSCVNPENSALICACSRLGATYHRSTKTRGEPTAKKLDGETSFCQYRSNRISCLYGYTSSSRKQCIIKLASNLLIFVRVRLSNSF
jgi:hypothetical protein